MRFRRKPEVILAMHFDGTLISAQKVVAWTKDSTTPAAIETLPCGGFELKIITLEGSMIVPRNASVIRGVAGEHYPCQEHIFNRIYEPVLED